MLAFAPRNRPCREQSHKRPHRRAVIRRPVLSEKILWRVSLYTPPGGVGGVGSTVVAVFHRSALPRQYHVPTPTHNVTTPPCHPPRFTLTHTRGAKYISSSAVPLAQTTTSPHTPQKRMNNHSLLPEYSSQNTPVVKHAQPRTEQLVHINQTELYKISISYSLNFCHTETAVNRGSRPRP